MKTTYTAELPDGREATRKSDRDYQYAVAVLSGKTREAATWKLYSFNGRYDLAAKTANGLRATVGAAWISGDTDYDVAIVPVTKK